MALKFWQVDSFTNEVFKGNPAAVFVLDEPIKDKFMQNIAVEMNLPETAFVELRPGRNPLLRWFTPMDEIDLCGHATLASAHIYFSEINTDAKHITFDTKFVGPLKVTNNRTTLSMDFPLRPGEEVPMHKVPDFVINCLSSIRPVYARKSRDLMLVYENEKDVLDMTPNFTGLLEYEDFIIATAPSSDPRHDFISRFFCAADGILEDPVTGSAHCTLAPYWANRLNKNRLQAYQASKRGGELLLDVHESRLTITGQAITVMNGDLHL